MSSTNNEADLALNVGKELEHYSNLDSDVGLREPRRKIPWGSVRSHTEVWDGTKYVYAGTRHSDVPTKRVGEDLRLFVNGKVPSKVLIVPI